MENSKKKTKLSLDLEKFEVARFSNPSKINGGEGGGGETKPKSSLPCILR